jgi:hypothetical protein
VGVLYPLDAATVVFADAEAIAGFALAAVVVVVIIQVIRDADAVFDMTRNRPREMSAVRALSGVSGLNSDIAKVKRLTHVGSPTGDLL